MKIVQKTLSFFLLALMSPLTTLASDIPYTKQIRAKIMDDFKAEQYNMIYGSNEILKEDINFFETQNQIMIFENIRQNNLAQKNDLDMEREILTNRVETLQEAITLIDEDIENTNKEILSLSREILSLYIEIQETKKIIDETNKEVAQTKEVLFDYIAHIYKKQNSLKSQDEKEIDSLKTILLSEGSLGDILTELHFTSLLELTGQNLVNQYRQLIKEMFVKKLDLEKKEKAMNIAKEQEKIKKKSLSEKKQFRLKVLDFTKGKEELFKQYVADKIKTDTNLKLKIIQNKIKLNNQHKEILEKYNCTSLDKNLLSDDIYLLETQNNYNCDELAKILTLESELKPFSPGEQNVFDWPVAPMRGLSSYYKDPEYTNYVGSTHDAIDIRVPQGTDIKAPADGYVTYLRAPEDEGYAYVVLKHANGFVSVYGHVNEVFVEKYQRVKKGEVFAKSGGEVGTFGAGPMTTGPHLHFEVFKDREYVDPLNHLDMTLLGEKNIPASQRYVYKYAQDYKSRYGIEYDGELLKSMVVFKLEGESEIERQKDLLGKYATRDFNNWEMWVEEAVDAKIDPSFMMCIGLAESGLGRNLKTAYNVGNVGNVDSGGTWDFDNARSGVYRIGRTLNNQFLGKYQTMDKLSRYGNPDGSIYASSPLNWQNNIVKCLSALKGEYIPDNFKFRLK